MRTIKKTDAQRVEEPIRLRISYRRWMSIWSEVLKLSPNSDIAVLRVVHSYADGIGGYGYATTSHYASESLELFIKDHRTQSGAFAEVL